MMTEARTPDEPRSLLGLRPPADLASSPLPEPVPQPSQPVAPSRPARPDYPVVSSGWDSEDGEATSKRADLMTALRAGIMLLLAMIGLGLLITG
ncbi:hypothetical protein ACLF3G_16470 [Falsiroseomonas sp. HC035]|uniref:hypothetical protein n=1 Tax=Falsiroseomonas sp. HC035 TaxID=3390999 RepID=UPI003D31549F